MNQNLLEQQNAIIIPKNRLWEMRIITQLLNVLPTKKKLGDIFMQNFWTTWKRFPWSKTTYICHALSVQNPLDPKWDWLVTHELMHAIQVDSWWKWFKQVGLLLFFPLPFYYSGRWYIERYPYLLDIRSGVKTVDQAVNVLWEYYLWPWPKDKMRAWFNKQLEP